MIFKKVLAVLAASFIVFALPARAALVLPDLHDPGWATDRYEPASWQNIVSFQGRSNVLKIGIDDTTNAIARPVNQQSSFYNTQGRQITVAGGVGDSLSADLWLDPNWASSTAGYVRTDLWGRAGGTEADTRYPIFGFTNYGGSPRLRVYDSDVIGAWVDLGTDLTPLFGTWVNLEITATSGGYEYSLNDIVVYTDNTVGPAGGGFTRAFLQAYNFNDPSLGISNNPAYNVHWANAGDNQVPTPATLPLALLGLWFVGGRGKFRSLISAFSQRLRRFEQERREEALAALGGMSMRLA